MVDNILKAAYVLLMWKLKSLTVDKILLPKYMNWSTIDRSLLFNEETAPARLKHVNTLFDFS